MSRREESVSVDEPKQKGFFRSARGRLATAGLATVLGLGGLGILSSQKTGDNNPSSPVPPGETITPNNSLEPTTAPAVTLEITPSPSGGSPFETTNPSSSPTETPLPAWVKEIPPAKWTINEVPLNELTKKSGQLLEYPVPDGTGYIFSMQDATIVAVEPDPENNTVWVTMTLGGDKLTRETKTVSINGEDKNYYKYKGLTIRYAFDDYTTVLKKNPAGSKNAESPVGVGLTYVAKKLQVGSTFSGILSLMGQGTKDQPELNNNTSHEIINSAGKQNIRDEGTFQMYAQTVVLP